MGYLTCTTPRRVHHLAPAGEMQLPYRFSRGVIIVFAHECLGEYLVYFFGIHGISLPFEGNADKHLPRRLSQCPNFWPNRRGWRVCYN